MGEINATKGLNQYFGESNDFEILGVDMLYSAFSLFAELPFEFGKAEFD